MSKAKLPGTNLRTEKLREVVATWVIEEFLRLLTVPVSIRRKQGGLYCYLWLLIIACQFQYERREVSYGYFYVP